MRFFIVSLLFVSFSILPACEDDPDNSPEGVFRRHVSAYVDAYCDRVMECCDTFDSRSECEEYTDLWTPYLSDPWLVVDMENSTACIDLLTQHIPASCEEVITPVHLLQYQECRLDTYGAFGEGDSCANYEPCGPGLFCSDDTDTWLCTVQGQEGDPCNPNLAYACAWDLLCLDEMCQPPLAVGEPCFSSEECGWEQGEAYACIDQVCAPQRANGEACADDSQCLSDWCDAECIDAVCEGTCVDATFSMTCSL